VRELQCSISSIAITQGFCNGHVNLTTQRNELDIGLELPGMRILARHPRLQFKIFRVTSGITHSSFENLACQMFRESQKFEKAAGQFFRKIALFARPVD
jgi:hypothetical protein